MAYGYPNYSNFNYGQNYGQYPNYGQTQQLQRFEIIHVNGENGARALQMAPNSNALVMDDTAPIVWLCQTDGAGYKTVQAFDITVHQSTAPADVSGLEARIKRLEEIINAKSDECSTETSTTPKSATKPKSNRNADGI